MPVEGGSEVKTYIPKRLREIAGHPPGVTDVTDESPVLTPNVSNVSGAGGVFPEKNGSEPTPQNLETQRPEPRDTVLPVPEPALTVWTLLRADWKLFLGHAIAEDDAFGSITATAETGGMVLPVNLKDVGSLTSAIKRLIEKYPDPLEVRISAQHDDSLFLRARFTRRMARPFENCEPVQA